MLLTKIDLKKNKAVKHMIDGRIVAVRDYGTTEERITTTVSAIENGTQTTRSYNDKNLNQIIDEFGIYDWEEGAV